ncbi:SymE family type I addiction module toxin [Oceanicoccus sagamiensis]|uniref:Toxin SymE-like domain-containing protein n=1 Tax=Oceanicoccus sagamiensis TaxID=716816 RepID=A0A1X9NIG5_9GAMM|nr:SymE family type I addiction module toxin [Oceanicoccus sagamiensis]ARN73773.1 hypothetical protein BST96_06385 [Oceanicoccus sagamiensis]
MAKRTIPPEPSSAQEKLSSYRQLKVRKSYYHYQYSDFQPRHRHASSPPVPWVQIKGYWLNQAGFTIDTLLSVEVKQGCIILKTQPT